MYLRPHFEGHFVKKGSANWPRVDRFEKSSTLSYTKLEFKWGPLYEKHCQLMYLGPTMQAILEKWGCQGISPNWTNYDL